MLECAPPVVERSEAEIRSSVNGNAKIEFAVSDLRVEIFHKIIYKLLANHDDGELNAQLTQATCWIANVTLKLKEFALSRFIVA
jgi:hypothetical protein